MELIGPWGRAALKLTGLERRVRGKVAEVASILGETLAEGIVREMYRVQPALHWFTVAKKGFPQPLIGGEMEQAVTYELQDGGFAVWAGVAGERARVARIQEYGVTIGVTPAMRGYLHAEGLHLSASTAYIVIPPRPFVRPAFQKMRGAARQLLWRAFREVLFGR